MTALWGSRASNGPAIDGQAEMGEIGENGKKYPQTFQAREARREVVRYLMGVLRGLAGRS